jgi:hypothetical protein
MAKLSLYLYDCIDDDLLITYLTNAGYDVQTPRGAGIAGVRDFPHLEHAAQHGRTLITRNPDDFIDLHQQ